MRLGAAYNAFDGLELLEISAASIRESVDYITVIYQNISNVGIQSAISPEPIMEDLKRRRLIDSFVEYVPNLARDGRSNEISKRNAGLVRRYW